jgi:ubiquinone/menaquinone biosynthesis C-methylase UbiE
MELSPKLYHYFVRPKWFSNILYNKILMDNVELKGKSILDFGCGIGSSSFLFEPSTYYGVDCDSNRIEYAKKMHPEYNFIAIKDDGRLPLSNSSIDNIMIFSVLHHIPTKSLSDCLKEFQRVLKSNGRLIVIEPCYYEKADISNWFMTKFDKGEYIRNEGEYLNIFRNANYRTKVIKRYNQLLFYNKIMFSASPIM